MQMERERHIGNGNGNLNYSHHNHTYSQFCNDYDSTDVDQVVVGYTNGYGNKKYNGRGKSPVLASSGAGKVSPFPSTTPPSSPPSTSPGGFGFIEHPVSKLDTLAGVAIKYGVEVADIKKMNGLVTDLQMFALKSLQIPLPGKHPPSPCISNGSDMAGQSSSERTPVHRMHCDLLDSFQSLRLTSSQRKVSPAMSTLQGYYGLKPPEPNIACEGFETAVYRKGDSREDGQYLTPSPACNLPLSRHRKSKSLANGFLDENNGGPDNQLIAESKEVGSEKWNDKLLRRRQKSEADFTSSEMLMREESSTGSMFPAITGKGLAWRPKAAANRADVEADGLTSVPFGLGDSSAADGFSGVRKSSSTSSLQDQDGSNSSIRPNSKWIFKPDLQALSAAAIARPIFDGLPKPVTGWKSKAALD